MQNTPRGIRPHIALFGRRNAGKSSLINALVNQDIALVSDTAGTTTDPVYKNMELLPFGPVVMIDTAGLDDSGSLGEQRVKASLKVLEKTDLALVVLEPLEKLQDCEKEVIDKLKRHKVNFIVVVNKCEDCDIPESLKKELVQSGADFTSVSALTNKGIEELKTTKIQKSLKDYDTGTIIGDIVNPGQIVVLVVPIDLAAPKGRLILPQVQTIRDLLDTDAIAVIAKERELKAAIDGLKEPPALVITDSQAFLKVAADVPEGVMFTSFSVIFARYKGDLDAYVDGIRKLEQMGNKGKILIAESCTHHQMADDMGRVKIPRWVRQNFGGKIEFDFCQGVNFPENLKEYDLVVQCGGCMTNRKAILSRIQACRNAGVAITNYGIIIAHLHGVLEEALKPFGIILEE